MVAPHRIGVRELSRSAFLQLRFTTLLFTRYSAVHSWLLTVVAWQGLGCPYFHPYVWCRGVLGGSIHNLRTIAPRYGELLNLLFILHLGIESKILTFLAAYHVWTCRESILANQFPVSIVSIFVGAAFVLGLKQLSSYCRSWPPIF